MEGSRRNTCRSKNIEKVDLFTLWSLWKTAFSFLKIELSENHSRPRRGLKKTKHEETIRSSL